MLEPLIILLGNSKGALIGVLTGGLHETFIVIREKKRKAEFWAYFLAIAISGFVGYLAYDLSIEADIPEVYRVLWTVVIALHSFLVFQIFTNPKFLMAIFKLYAPMTGKISEKDLVKALKELEESKPEKR